ncbi:Dephospho-CoA kinase [Candidatus Sulfotelmatomonas gaucii]|uniref:Dephospho-CoA kinase n=1 Tax=Candidatus Sulfuritelmatomonas gaucii TaxID=2043161 RepID=A0A2N9M8R9_9BACT|nr:Dephospho-CoA kinase [Candidatus Sulfotelmatomonas gaucii]
MLRVGLTGGLGSGKSTVAAMLLELGAQVIEADALGRQMMEPGQEVYAEIVRHFGPQVVNPDNHLNRTRLAELAFREGRLQELNAIVHPPVIEAQAHWMEEVFARDSSAVAVIESALIFEVVRDARARDGKDNPLADWRRRIDRVIVVTAPDDLKIARYAARVAPNAADRSGIEADARNRLSHQVPDADKTAQADYVLDNSGDIAVLREQVLGLWPLLKAESNKSRQNLSLQ